MSDRELTRRVEPSHAGIDPTRLAEAERFISDELARLSLPGAGLVLARHGSIVLERYWGTCCTMGRPDQPYDGTILNQLYSYSKIITSTVVAMLHQEGLLDYDAPICRYVPQFAGEGREAITLRHCLTHSTGIPNPPLPQVHTSQAWVQAVEVMCREVPAWPPGSRTAYHGRSGSFLAAEAALRVTGAADWDQLCRARLFGPLGADSLSFAVPKDPKRIAVTPHPGQVPQQLETECLGHPGAGCFGTLRDAIRVLQLQLNGGGWNGRSLLTQGEMDLVRAVQYADQIAAAKAANEKPQHEFWGLGWLLRGTTTSGWFGFGKLASPRSFGHAGIGTIMGIADPDRDLAIMFSITSEPGGDDVVKVRNGVTDRLVAAVAD